MEASDRRRTREAIGRRELGPEDRRTGGPEPELGARSCRRDRRDRCDRCDARAPNSHIPAGISQRLEADPPLGADNDHAPWESQSLRRIRSYVYLLLVFVILGFLVIGKQVPTLGDANAATTARSIWSSATQRRRPAEQVCNPSRAVFYLVVRPFADDVLLFYRVQFPLSSSRYSRLSFIFIYLFICTRLFFFFVGFLVFCFSFFSPLLFRRRPRSLRRVKFTASRRFHGDCRKTSFGRKFFRIPIVFAQRNR